MRTLSLQDNNWSQWKLGDTNAVMAFNAATDGKAPDYANSVITFKLAQATDVTTKPGDYKINAPGRADSTGKQALLDTSELTDLKPGTYVVEMWLTDKDSKKDSIYPSDGFVSFTIDENTMGVSSVSNISTETLQAVYTDLLQKLYAFKSGVPGKDGLTPKLKAGTIIKLAPDATPTFLLTADPNDKTGATYIIDLGIPQGYKGDRGDKGDTGAAGKSAYDIWIDAGNSGTQQDFIQAIRGPQGMPGANGKDGKDGITPHVGANGNWFEGDTDTGVSAKGQAGKDADLSQLVSVDQFNQLRQTVSNNSAELKTLQNSADLADLKKQIADLQATVKELQGTDKSTTPDQPKSDTPVSGSGSAANSGASASDTPASAQPAASDAGTTTK